jgi:hypothetical protein
VKMVEGRSPPIDGMASCAKRIDQHPGAKFPRILINRNRKRFAGFDNPNLYDRLVPRERKRDEADTSKCHNL